MGWEIHVLFIHWSFGLFVPLECKLHEGRDPVGLGALLVPQDTLQSVNKDLIHGE